MAAAEGHGDLHVIDLHGGTMVLDALEPKHQLK